MRYFLIIALLLTAGCAVSAETRAYLSAECTKDGYTEGTDAHRGCMRAKRDAMQQGGGIVMGQQSYGRTQQYCRSSSSGRSTVCY